MVAAASGGRADGLLFQASAPRPLLRSPCGVLGGTMHAHKHVTSTKKYDVAARSLVLYTVSMRFYLV